MTSGSGFPEVALRQAWDWERMLAEVSYYFPAYDFERLCRTPFITIFCLIRQLNKIIETDPRRV